MSGHNIHTSTAVSGHLGNMHQFQHVVLDSAMHFDLENFF